MYFIALAVLASSVASDPINSCDLFATFQQNKFTLESSAWGAKAGRGAQCITLQQAVGPSISWQVRWNWADNPFDTKSFPNAVIYPGQAQQLSQIVSMKTVWNYKYITSNPSTFKANVVYDIFTSSYPGGPKEYEIMVWLSNFNTGPLKDDYSAGVPPLLAGVNIDGKTYDLWRGHNEGSTAYSFVRTDASAMSAIRTTELLNFVKFLVNNGVVPASQYWLSIGAGSEVFTGDAVFTTKAYSIDVIGQSPALTGAAWQVTPTVNPALTDNSGQVLREELRSSGGSTSRYYSWLSLLPILAIL